MAMAIEPDVKLLAHPFDVIGGQIGPRVVFAIFGKHPMSVAWMITSLILRFSAIWGKPDQFDKRPIRLLLTLSGHEPPISSY